MNDIPTFGFANDTGEPLIFDIEYDAWRDAAGAVTWASECRGVTLAQTVDPGQVVVDAADLRDLVRAVQNVRVGHPGAEAWKRLRAALAAAEPPKRGCDRDLHISNGGAGCGCGKIPPKADPAETDAPVDVTPSESELVAFLKEKKDHFDRINRVVKQINDAEDRAAKRGRDEALAVVVKALKSTSQHLYDSDFSIGMGDVAWRIEREQGGNR